MNKWTPEVIAEMYSLTESGFNSKQVADELTLSTGIRFTASAVRNALIYYRTPEEHEEDSSVRNLIEKRRSQNITRNVRRDMQKLIDVQLQHSTVVDSVKLAAERINKAKPVTVKPSATSDGVHMTAELLLSDLQMGKVMPNYNTEIARKRLEAYTEAAIFKIKQHQKSGYVFDKIVLALLGDIIESDEKHISSARSCDSGTAEQLANVQEALFLLVIEPLARLGIPMDIVCVTGNHDWNQSGLNMFKPGLVHLSWPLYNALRLFTEFRGYDHVKFTIPQGCFHIHNIYGHNVLYEHGVGVSTSEASLKNRRQQRTQQTRKMITYFRMGDKHNISRFNEDTLVVNGAFFGSDTEGTEYSGISGYESDAGQIMFFHVPRKDDRRLTIYDSFVIQLAHIL
jgi:hypothetical protein